MSHFEGSIGQVHCNVSQSWWCMDTMLAVVVCCLMYQVCLTELAHGLCMQQAR